MTRPVALLAFRCSARIVIRAAACLVATGCASKAAQIAAVPAATSAPAAQSALPPAAAAPVQPSDEGAAPPISRDPAPPEFKEPRCPSALSFDAAAPLIEAALCKTTEARFLGRPVCVDWRAFLRSGPPRLPPKSIAVGATFRVEQARNGKIAWSENNPLYAVQSASPTVDTKAVRILDVSPDNADEAREATRYLASAFKHRWDHTASLDTYVTSRIGSTPEIPLSVTPSGAVADRACRGLFYLRQSEERLYALLSTVRSNAWEYDSHPVLYFVVLAPP